MKEELRKKMGAVLKLERERLNVDREELAQQLKISDTYLERIEQGSNEDLPSDIYFELFAKSYAEAIGVDYAATTEALKEEIGASMAVAESEKPAATGKPIAGAVDGEEEEIDAEEEPGMRQLKKLGIMLGGVVGLLILFMIVYKVFLSDDQPVAVDDSAGDGQSEQVTTPDERSQLANYDWEVPVYVPPSPLVLKLRARDASWSTVLADGDTVIFRGLGAGREYVVTANYRIQVSIALPRLVETELNGKIVDLRDPNTRRISRVVIDQLNLKEFLTDTPSEDAALPPAQVSPQRSVIPPSPPTESKSDSGSTADSAATTKGGTVEL